MSAETKRKRPSGSDYMAKTGLVNLNPLVTPEERELIRHAAAISDHKSMAAFTRHAVVEAARAVLAARGISTE